MHSSVPHAAVLRLKMIGNHVEKFTLQPSISAARAVRCSAFRVIRLPAIRPVIRQMYPSFPGELGSW